MVSVKHTRLLLEKLAEKTQQKYMVYSSFRVMSKYLNRMRHTEEITAKYLAENLWAQVEKSERAGIAERRFSIQKLDQIAIGIGFKNFDEFCLVVNNPLPEDLKACVGVWRSYVRANNGLSILAAPIRLFLNEKNEVIAELKATKEHYVGKVEARCGCMVTTLYSDSSILNLVMKLSSNNSPSVLLGVFSGISSAGQPVAGREIFVRENDNFDSMNWYKEVIGAEHSRVQRGIRDYLGKYKHNDTKVEAVTFGPDDLLL